MHRADSRSGGAAGCPFEGRPRWSTLSLWPPRSFVGHQPSGSLFSTVPPTPMPNPGRHHRRGDRSLRGAWRSPRFFMRSAISVGHRPRARETAGCHSLFTPTATAGPPFLDRAVFRRHRPRPRPESPPFLDSGSGASRGLRGGTLPRPHGAPVPLDKGSDGKYLWIRRPNCSLLVRHMPP
jgi:hypothetical protein